MVRILAGTLLSVGQDKIAPEEIPAILKSRDRRLAGKTMPPQGLCLEQVHYPQDLFAKGGCT
jgi:tRNA pseudouridine38-40 synthase